MKVKVVCESCKGTGKKELYSMISICKKCKGKGYKTEILFTQKPIKQSKQYNKAHYVYRYDKQSLNIIDQMIRQYESRVRNDAFKEGALTALKRLRNNFSDRREDFAKKVSEYIKTHNKEGL